MKKNILVIDKEVRTRMLADGSLSMDYNVNTFENCYEALEWMKTSEEDADILVVDIDSLSTNINELINSLTILNNSKEIYTIIVSSSESKKLTLMPGIADAFLMKPFSAKHLKDSLNYRLHHIRYW
jgi:response regulator RpfG family c-di-GMP phosphodiesterase